MGGVDRRNAPALRGYAQELRKNMTPRERRLWSGSLKELPVTVNRQKVIGPYIVDFYCAKAKLVIELDGSQHCGERGKRVDAERDACLRKLGLTVLRYANSDVDRNFSGACEELWRHLE